MASDTQALAGVLSVERPHTSGGSISAVSWGAILAGAAVAAAVSLILLALGAGFGLAAPSPGWGLGPSVAAFSVLGGIWLIVMQWVASGVGGYITGRLRVRWAGLHTHEVFFRDTAHGFLAWAVSTLVVAVLVAGTAALGAGAAATAGAAGYDVDAMFRSTAPAASVSPADRAEAARILAAAAAKDNAPDADRTYLAGVVAARTGLAPADAQGRVDAAFATTLQTAEKAKKAAAAASIFMAIAMLIGALIACAAAALGGQQRDEHA